MHSLSHAMTHRGAGASRANSRWHPYTPPRSASVSSTPSYTNFCPSQDGFILTPASSLHSISPLSIRDSTPSIPLPRQIPPARTCSQSIIAKQSPSKATYVTALVDQAVKVLTDIWKPECIPMVFATSTRASSKPSTFPTPPSRSHSFRPSIQLPSPASPSTQLTPPATPSPASLSCSGGAMAANSCKVATSSDKDLVPMKTFVHEVLRRSRTTCSVLQSALCYIEAIRGAVPQLAEKEQVSDRTADMEELCEAIQQHSPGFSGSCQNVSSSSLADILLPANSYCAMQTACVGDMQPSSADSKSQTGSETLPPVPVLPSPLLCPRRTFLAALILASKFLQDRCYSNRAWAKLSGLPPREVGRCERALGEALEWRLWVGKGMAPVPPGVRALSRTQSECNFSSASSHYLSPPLSDAGSSPEECRMSLSGHAISNASLRRAATLPDEATLSKMTASTFPCPIPFLQNFTGHATPSSVSPPSSCDSEVDTPSTCNTNWSPPRYRGSGGAGGIHTSGTKMGLDDKCETACNTIRIAEPAMAMESAPWFFESSSVSFRHQSMLDQVTRELCGQV